MIDPYQIYEEIDISDDFNNTTSLITKLNKRIFIDNGNVCVTNGISGIEENKLRQLSNKTDLVVIDVHGIGIYTLNENKIERYFWHNNEWKNFGENFRHSNIYKHFKHFKLLIRKILQNEFDNSKHSIPFPIFIMDDGERNIVEDVINDNLVLPKFGIKMLKIAIENKIQDAVQQIIELTQDYSENYMTIISLNLAILCDYYPDFIIKYISSTSIILSPYCIRIGNSKNPSLHSYANIIYIKESNTNNNVFKPISANYEVVNFIVPFPQICVYQDDSKRLKIIMMIPKSNSIWNEFLYKPKSILFYNLDSNHFYNWWNFAAIIDFKVFESFGIYFAIIIGVVKKVFPFLVVLLFIVLGYAQAFFIVLRSNSINDDNDPRNVATKYVFVNPDGTITVYNLLTGDSGSLLSFTYREHSIMTILLTVFNYPPFISKKLRELVAFSDDNNKLEKKIDQLTKQNIEFKEDLIKQNVELKQQLERIINYIGVEQG
ncbi:hypothetical protein RhiirA5_432136 [Rhizophagus irregularis]|uniref:Uncharacterized protein n=1 Tax=Rhizophagus irregularis TaxID=588596 RepID=A0A2N0NTU9_9GLOM|nr:hypothetical protein RhiirA5_432136 [Rhizophagus irregularis]